jgi:MFS family permease
MASAVILGMIVTMFPEPADQAKAIGVYTFVAAGGGAVGLLAGGILTEVLNWHWIFIVNLPIGIATWILASRLIENDVGIGLHQGADVPGAFLIVTSLMLGVYTIVEAAERGWGSAHTLILGAVSVALLVGFVVRERLARTPLVPLRIFRSRTTSGANLVQALTIGALFGLFFLGALYMQAVLGYGPLEVGLAFLPVALIIGVFSVGLSARLIMRFGPTQVLLPGLVLIAAALALFVRVPVDGNYVVDLLPSMILFGFGGGLFFAALMTLAMSAATASDSGLASGLVNTTQQVGGAVGLAVLATFSTTRTDSLLERGESTASALLGGYHLAWAIGLGLAIAGILLAVVLLRPQAAPQEEEAGLGAAQPAYSEE